jgi:hypothetical protein
MARVKSALRPDVDRAARDAERKNALCQRAGIALPGAGAVRQVRSEPRIMPRFSLSRNYLAMKCAACREIRIDVVRVRVAISL